MKHFFGIFSATLVLLTLLGGCTSGGNVSDRDDGMIGTQNSRDEHGESSSDLFDEEQEDDNAAKSRRIVRRR